MPTSPPENFTYDPVGNRTSSHLSALHSHDPANRLLEDSNFTYTYDQNGNLASKTSKANGEVTTYTYDAENQLIRVERSGLVAEYRYDALGRRIEKVVNGVSTRFVYDNEDLIAEVDGTGATRAFYIHGPGIDEPLLLGRFGAGGGTFVYHADGLGSITTLTDLNGNPVRSYTYDSFGRLVAQTGTLTNPYTYTGRELDPESGLYYYRFRHYDPSTGRFLQEDPIAIRGNDLNFYAYSLNNPTTLRDPHGLWFAVDDVFTGPVDEAIVLGGLGIAALLGSKYAQDTLDQIGSQFAVMFSRSGSEKGVGKNFQNIAQHLANLTGNTVGGVPPQKPKDPRDFRHWRTEIQAFLENTRKAELSERQLVRELKKFGFNDAQIQDVVNTLRELGFGEFFRLVCPL